MSQKLNSQAEVKPVEKPTRFWGFPGTIGMLISGVFTLAYGILAWHSFGESWDEYKSCSGQPVEMTFSEFVSTQPRPRWVKISEYKIGPLSWSKKERSAHVSRYIHLIAESDSQTMNPDGVYWFAVMTDNSSSRRFEEFQERDQFTGMIRTSCKPPPIELSDGRKISEASVRAIGVGDGPSFTISICLSIVSAISLTIFSGLAYLQFYVTRLKPAPTTKDFSEVRIRRIQPTKNIEVVRWNKLDHLSRFISRWRKIGWVFFVVSGIAFLNANFAICGLSMFFGLVVVLLGCALLTRPVPLMIRRIFGSVPEQDRIQRFVKFWLEHPEAPARDLGYVRYAAVSENEYRVILPEVPFAVVLATIENGRPFAELITITAMGRVISTHNKLESWWQAASGVPLQVRCVDTTDILKLCGTHIALLEEYFEKNQDDWVLYMTPAKVPQVLAYVKRVVDWSEYSLINAMFGLSFFKPEKIPCPAELGRSSHGRWWFEWECRPEWRSMFDDVEFDESEIPKPNFETVSSN